MSIQKMIKNKKISTAVTGEKNGMWNGGIWNHMGYRYIYSPKHPFNNRNYVAEHRLVMEEWMRLNCPESKALIEINGLKYLREDWDVHHKNGKRNDNTIENLELFTHSKHMSIEKLGKKNPMFGKITPDATRKKISISIKKRLSSDPKYKAKIMKNLKYGWKIASK